MRYQNSQLQDRLASEYVMGTLTGAARRRFEKLLRQYPEMQQQVDAWAERLQPLNDDIVPVTPPDHVWKNVLETIETPQLSRRPNQSFYRYPAMLVASILLMISIVFFYHGQQDQPRVYVKNNHGEINWVLEPNVATHHLRVKTITPVTMSENKVCVLWLVQDNAKPRQVGVLPDMAGSEAILHSEILFTKQGNASIVISMETRRKNMDMPRGEIIHRGPWNVL